jgi:hypothetical protein
LSENNDVAGAGLGQTQEDSIEDCQALCESTEGCTAFMYGGASTVHDSKLCELSSTGTPNNSWGSNLRFCQNTEPPTSAPSPAPTTATPSLAPTADPSPAPTATPSPAPTAERELCEFQSGCEKCATVAFDFGLSDIRSACYNCDCGEKWGRQCGCAHCDLKPQNLCNAFVQGPKTGCPPGYAQPKSAEHCKLVAQASNVRYWGGAGHSSSADPRGCIYRTPDKDIYFNTHIRGSTSRNDRRTVCVKVDSEITSDRKL